MKSCFFIGHREASIEILTTLTEAVERHIAQFGVTEFIVGNYGGFTSAELKKIWAKADNGDSTAAAVLILNYTGMRPGELLSLEISTHIHLHGQERYFKTGSKTDARKNRIIPLPEYYQKSLMT